MKKVTTLLLFLLIFLTTIAVAQNKEKIKGSKIVSIEQKEIGDFDSVELGDNIEVYLERGEKCGLKIEADDNLHDVISIDLNENRLNINTNKKVTRFKKMLVRVTYNKNLNTIVAKEESVVNAIQEIQLNDITVKTQDNAVVKLNVNTANFTLQTDDKSKTELNLKAENVTLEMSKYSNLKALISAKNLKCDMYQKSQATLEGEINNALVRLDNNSKLIAKNLVIKTAELIAENFSDCSINISSNLSISASGNSSIDLYGDQKIEMTQFVDKASLSKKPTK